MIEIVVEELPEKLGPGDIVGAFTNEAKIAGDQIGKISFTGQKALVEVSEEVFEKVLQVMDGNRIAGVKVDVYPREPEVLLDQEVRDYLHKFRELVEDERQEEMDAHLQEIKNLTGRQREEKGRAILHLKGRDQGEGYAGRHLVKFLRQQPGERLPENEIKVGDLVMLSLDKPLHPDNPTGTVVEMTGYSLTVVFDNRLPSFAYGKGLRLDLFVNDITFQRMFEALDKLAGARGRLLRLRDILTG
ncbi:MAG: DbpA RNA binding domain-containing protein, partial [Halanaerobium sp.]|nr:DbpA RNA binding domain-containing protein [Halanaerobium sp.]